MFAPLIFPLIAGDSDCVALLQGAESDDDLRFFEFSDAPVKSERPYATWQVVAGLPENYLGQVPDIDSFTVQIDVWALTGPQARQIAAAIRDAIEPAGHVTSYNGEGREEGTRLFRVSFSADFFTART